MENLAKATDSERLKIASACLKAKEDCLRRSLPSDRRIQPSEFTKHIAKERPNEGELQRLSYFETEAQWEKDKSTAIGTPKLIMRARAALKISYTRVRRWKAARNFHARLTNANRQAMTNTEEYNRAAEELEKFERENEE